MCQNCLNRTRLAQLLLLAIAPAALPSDVPATAVPIAATLRTVMDETLPPVLLGDVTEEGRLAARARATAVLSSLPTAELVEFSRTVNEAGMILQGLARMAKNLVVDRASAGDADAASHVTTAEVEVEVEVVDLRGLLGRRDFARPMGAQPPEPR